ncbi:uncharacterized protein [Parasteatoda tepidariorum]|uniref:uncharacterized protein n=1 Tax=Parasteatoda tepidariorum TaxID=114398 RepID=UPI0039BD16CD
METSEEQKRIIEEKDKLIKRQFIRIEELENELSVLKEERDSLLCDVNKLRFELEMSELKRLKDVRTPTISQQSSISGEIPLPTPDTEEQPSSMDENDAFSR